MYEEMKITTPSGGCDCQKKQQSKTCKDTYNKIDLGCFGQNHFAVENYFSELVHDWEKEAARHNLGITELENIHYETEMDEDNNELLTYIVFQYRKGYELVTRKFRVAPKGDKGDSGPKGNDGKSAYDIARENGFIGTITDWLSSLKATISKVEVSYVDSDCEQPSASVEEDSNHNLVLYLRITKPNLTTDDIVNLNTLILNQISASYYNKQQIDNLVSGLESRISALEGIISALGIHYGNS